MILWFLRCFRAYRELEAELVRERARTSVAESQLREMTDRFAQAQRSEIESTRKVADAFARRHGGPVFDIAGEIPIRPDEFEPIPRSKAQASSLVEQMERDFHAELAKNGQFTNDVRK